MISSFKEAQRKYMNELREREQQQERMFARRWQP